MSTILISTAADRRAIDCATPVSPEQFVQDPPEADVVLLEPLFHDFRGAESTVLGYPFMALSKAHAASRMVIFLTYTFDNARQYKGYVIDLKAAMKERFAHTDVLTVPLINCGVPIAGTVLAMIGADAPWMPVTQQTPIMPSEYFPGMLAHVPRNRPNFPIKTSSRFIGAVRSDFNLLPPLSAWAGRSLMVEYRKDRTTEIRRMLPEHVGRLFGVQPCQYTDDLSLVLPAGIIESFR